MPAIIKRMDEKHLMETDEVSQNNLLNTIRIPKNLHFLTERLPKANYSPMKIKKVDKHKFLQTLAGYKDLSPIASLLEDNIIKTGAESVDSHKKQFKEQKNLGNIHLPQLQAHSSTNSNNENDEILKTYAVNNEKGKEKHRLNSLNKQNVAEGLDKNIFQVDKHTDKLPDQMILKLDIKKVEDKERDRSRDIVRKERERDNSSIILNPGYRIHENAKELLNDKHLNSVKNIYGSSSNKKLPELSPIKNNSAMVNEYSGSLKKIKPVDYKHLDEYLYLIIIK